MEGTHLHLQSPGNNPTKHQFTVGKPLEGGKGKHGEVHDLQGDHAGKAVVKKYDNKEDADKEIATLHKVGHLHASGEHDGQKYAVMDKVHGTKLEDTAAWKAAKDGKEKQDIYKHAIGLMGETQLHHATEHGVMHECVSCSGSPSFCTISPAHLVIFTQEMSCMGKERTLTENQH
jgi:hypothetical protein